MRFKVRCGNCGHKMRSDRFSSGVLVHSCLNCHRVMVCGAGDEVAMGNMFDAFMKARGYHRVR